MTLKFLEPDPKIAYIGASLTPEESAGEPDHDFYRRGERPALLVIDMQRGYVSPEPKPWVKGLPDGIAELIDGATAATGQLIVAAREAGLPVLYTGTRYLPDGSDCGVRGEKFPHLAAHMREGLPWVEIDERLAPRDGEVVVWKQAASGFFGTHLAPLLIHRKIDTCIIAGTATSGCVRAAAVDAIAANFRTVVVEEAVCDKSLWAHKATLFDLWRYIATVASVRDVLDWMAEWGERNGTATP